MYQITGQQKSQKENKINSFWKNNKTFFLVGFLVLLITFGTVFTGTGEQPRQYEEIKVESGETLWEIVKMHYGDNINISRMIYEIREINELDDPVLQSGQKLLLPQNEKY